MKMKSYIASLMYIAPYIDYIPAVPSIAVRLTAKENSMGQLTEELFTVTQISTPPIVSSDTLQYVLSNPTTATSATIKNILDDILSLWVWC